MRLEITYEDSTTEIISFFEKSIIVGRGREADLKISTNSISRKHLRIEVEKGDVFITDLNSANGVFINDERVEPGVKVQFTTYFPVVMGPNITMSILSEEDPRQSGAMTGSVSRATMQSENKTGEKTQQTQIMKDLAMPLTRKEQLKAEKEKEKNKKQSNLPSVIIMAILAAAGYLYYDRDALNMVLGSLNFPTIKSEEEKRQAAIPVISPLLIKSRKIVNIFKCDSEFDQKICPILGELTNDYEGFLLDKKGTLFLVYNLKGKNPFTATGATKRKDRFEAMLLHKMLDPKVRQVAKEDKGKKEKKLIKSLVAIGIIIIDEEPLVFNRIAMQVGILTRFTDKDISDIFENIFTKGNFRLYKKFINPFIDARTVFQK